LPDEVRLTLTALIVRLILDHADGAARIAGHDAAAARPSPLAMIDAAALSANLRTVWSAPATDVWLKKRVVRTVIHEVFDDTERVSELSCMVQPVAAEKKKKRGRWARRPTTEY
jgi:hypothetical protein